MLTVLETPKADLLREAIEKANVVTPASAVEAVLQVVLEELNMAQEKDKPYP